MKEENNENRQGFPDRKISETLIDFARPFVSIIDQDTTTTTAAISSRTISPGAAAATTTSFC